MPEAGRFGRYRELALLAQGGMGRVILAALDGPHGVQKLLVLKEMLPDLAREPEYLAMFAAEARLASRLDHPNIVQTYELAEDAGRYCLVMEYLEGQALHTITARMQRQVPKPMLLRVLARLLAGLHYAHELADHDGRPLGIVHRDVTPHNVFVGYGGAIKLVDFGIAKGDLAALKTRSGVFKGKIAYAAPEQLENADIDRRADIFAVGVILWEALAGRRIGAGLPEAAIVRQRVVGDPSVASVAPEAPPELIAICMKAMQHDREARYATAADMQTAIEQAAETLSLRASDEEVGRLVAEQFDAERSQIRRLVQERLAAPNAATPALPSVPRPPESTSDVSDVDGLSEKVEPTATLQPAGGGPSDRTPMTQSVGSAVTARERARWFLAAVAIASAVGVFAAARLLHRGVAAVAPLPSVAAEPAPPREPASIAPPASEVVALAVRASATARVELDGVDLGATPFDGKVPRAAGQHQLVLTASGFKRIERSIALDRDVHVELVLEAEKPSTPANAAPPRAGPRNVESPDLPGRMRGGRPAKPIETVDPYRETKP